MKLGLGTAQFGANYGISNEMGQTKPDEVSKILSRACSAGIQVLDTAALYGDSEHVLGKELKNEYNNQFSIITKTVNLDRDKTIEEASEIVVDAFNSSLKKLNQKTIYGLLVHNAQDLLQAGGEIFYSKLKNLKEQGLVKKIGVSVYSPEEVSQILKRYQIDLVQGPLNVLDQRMMSSGMLAELSSRKIEFHARSIFLQGLLLMDPITINKYFSDIRGTIKKFQNRAQQHGLTALEAALSFVLGIREVGVAICGVNSLTQLEEIIAAEKKVTEFRDFSEYAVNDLNIIDPSRWQLA
ncbi:MAG: aldo/keto reductase [Candidatus Scalindua sp.]